MNKYKIPVVTRSQMAEVDNLMINEYGITLIQMMENAGRNLAELVRKVLGEEFMMANILAVCGGGNNGGGGMAAVRHLHNWGADVTVALANPAESLKKAPKHQLNSIKQMDIDINTDFPKENYSLIIDALIGYGLHGAPRGKVAEWIRWINEQDAVIIALDIPSGLDADSGQAPGDCIEADATLTLALPKIGMTENNSKRYIGELFLADISVPQKLLKTFFDEIPDLFSSNSIIPIDNP